MNTSVVVLADERESRVAQAWELAEMTPPQNLTIAARIAAHCLSCVKRKAKLVAQQAPWDIKHTESLNLVSWMLDFPSWRDLQTYAKQFHTLSKEQWRSDTLSLRLVSACWVLTPKQEKLPVAQSVLSRKLKVTVPGVSAAGMSALVRVAMCAPEQDHESDDQVMPAETSILWSRTHYRERFVARISAGMDPEPLKANALGMLKKMAPSLPAEVAVDLVDFCLGGPLTELLVNHETWLWPQADAQDFRLWGHEHREAAQEADRLQELEESTSLSGWLFDSESVDLRRWQETYLTGQKLRRKGDIAFALALAIKATGEAPTGLKLEFMEWRNALLEEALRQRKLSKLAPVPHHLRYLAEMTFIRLDALFDYYDPAERTYRAAGVAAILEAAAKRPTLPTAEFIAEEVCPPEERRFHFPGFEFVKTLTAALAPRIQSLVDHPAELRRLTARWRLDTPQADFICEHCWPSRPSRQSQQSRPVTLAKLPPFIRHCYCREVRWHSSALLSEKVKHQARPYHPDECYSFPEHYTTVMWWALHCWLRLPNRPEFPAMPAKMIEREFDRGRL